ncbi:MAG: Uma2 family endonuclease [Bdellovibrio bacteriovorus]
MSSSAVDLVRRHRYTVEDYYRMAEVGILAPDARVELIDGEVIELPPIGAPHAGVVTDLQNRLIAAIGNDAIVRVQNPIHLGPHDEPQPDIALVTPPAAKYRMRHPGPADILLLIEVAETNLRLDRDLKLCI